MTKEVFLSNVETFSHSQGCWGRMLRDFAENPGLFDEFCEETNVEQYNNFVDWCIGEGY